MHENLAAAHDLTIKTLSGLEVENTLVNQKNQKLVRELLELTGHDPSWKEEIDDEDVKAQLNKLEIDQKRSKTKWETIKGITSAVVVGSGVDWAEDETLRSLVLDEADD